MNGQDFLSSVIVFFVVVSTIALLATVGLQ